MSDTPEQRYSIGELVQASGVSRRTIRYYVQRGLLPPPEGAGRGHYYRPEHLDRLMLVKELQEKGVGLEEIRSRLEGGLEAAREELPPSPVMEVVTRIHVREGVEILLSQGTRPPSPGRIRALAEAAARILSEGE